MSGSQLPAGNRVIVSEFGESPTDAIERFMTLEEMPPPDVSQLSPRDVVIAVKSASINWVDLLMSSGQYQHMAKPPYTPGLEYAGVVAWKGREVRHVVEGEEVMVDGFLAGPRSLGAYQRWGGFATYAVAPDKGVYARPERLTLDQSCNLLGNYETAYHCLVTRGRVKKGETVLVLGASGATGLAAVQVAKLLGATVIATGRSAQKLAIVKEHGADHLITTRTIDGELAPFRDEIKALTGGKGVDVVYDGVGGALSLEALRSVRFGARFIIVGWASTPFVADGKGRRGAPNANTLPTNLIMMKGVDVLGSPMAISTANDPSIRTTRLAQVLQWADEGAIKPYVSRAYPLTAFKQALLAKWNSEIVGGCVLHP